MTLREFVKFNQSVFDKDTIITFSALDGTMVCEVSFNHKINITNAEQMLSDELLDAEIRYVCSAHYGFMEDGLEFAIKGHFGY